MRLSKVLSFISQVGLERMSLHWLVAVGWAAGKCLPRTGSASAVS